MKKITRWDLFIVEFSSIDWKSNIKGMALIVPVLLLFTCLFFNQEISHYFKKQRYKGEVNGQLLDYHENKQLSHSLMGSSMTTMNYEIKYVYSIRSQNYNKSTLISRFRTNIYELELLKTRKETLKIKFDIENPFKSIVIFDGE